jgi:hypothetical protein
MVFEEKISWLASFFGGGIVAAIFNWIRSNKAELKKRKIEFLDLQLTRLYGPLFYFVCQCEKLFELDKRWDAAYCEEYVEKEWSQTPEVQEGISKEASNIIELRNAYIVEVEKNSEHIKEILNNNYAYIDQDDIETFTLFYEHYIRRKLEVDDKKKLKLPIGPYKNVGDISFLRPEFISRVKEKFLKKKNELEELNRTRANFWLLKRITKAMGFAVNRPKG